MAGGGEKSRDPAEAGAPPNLRRHQPMSSWVAPVPGAKEGGWREPAGRTNPRLGFAGGWGRGRWRERGPSRTARASWNDGSWSLGCWRKELRVRKAKSWGEAWEGRLGAWRPNEPRKHGRTAESGQRLGCLGSRAAVGDGQTRGEKPRVEEVRELEARDGLGWVLKSLWMGQDTGMREGRSLGATVLRKSLE